MLLEQIKRVVVEMMEAGLSPRLYYHDIRHTLDVFEVATAMAKQEEVSAEETLLLQVAALFHDIGFLKTRAEHESASCEIAHEVLPQFGFAEAQIARICGMIMATKIPQSPQNFLEQILCDADLDYLGRPDFHFIANRLFLELKAYDILHDEQAWNRLQVMFMRSHQYFTEHSRNTRGTVKRQHLQEIVDQLSPHAFE